jgi:cell division protein FtsI (penicillin-binding protein 3)
MERRFIRHYVIIAILILAMATTVWRYGSLALQGGIETRNTTRGPIAIRGSIYDRNGRLLAVDTDLYDVSIWRPAIDQARSSSYAKLLADVLGMDQDSLHDLLSRSSPDFAYLARRISGTKVRDLEDVIQASRINGVRIDRIAGRIYPERNLAAHLIGFVGMENTGLAGAESAFDRQLAADPARHQGGYAYGNAVYLTIDADLQYRLESLCRAAMQEHRAEAVVMLAMEARTGRIAAYVSLPDFDPNQYQQADAADRLDRIAIYAYEPGSVFKVFTMSAVLALGGIDEHSSFVADGSYRRTLPSGETIVINDLGVYGTVNLTRILEYSSNVGAAHASDSVSATDFYAKLREFGFGERLGADLVGESPGVLRQPASWSARSKPTIAIGQEVLVTALQVTAASTVLANGGVLIRPRTLLRVVRADGTIIDQPEPLAIRRVLDEHSARTTLKAMESVVLDSGTGRRARIEDLNMSVKTGTAQMIDPATRRYSDTDFIASTLALFPSENPEYILYTAIIKPRGSSFYGGRIAAPLIRDAANIIADLYGVDRAASAMAVHGGRLVIQPLESIRIGDSMPDLSGTPKRSLTALLEREDLNIEIEGEGYVVGQEPLPGAAVPAGSTIRLRLE